ncbi:MAG: hypothetical protein D5S00_05660 [Tindallia sp. MSAO_Bac2]|nr:MAG: hypothetical protein D5S00_05660 [Tindallia sp. MSAO_Bac2]
MTLEADPVEGGTVNEDAEGWYPPGAEVTVEATADTGWKFVNWTKDGTEVSTEASFDYTIPEEDVTLVANFEQLYTLSMAVVGSGGAWDRTDEGPYQAGSEVDIEAELEPGWKFVNWEATAGEFDDDEAADTTFTMPAEDATVTANFIELGIEGDSVVLDGDEDFVNDSGETVWVIDIEDFIADGALNPGGPNDERDFELVVTFVTGFTVNSVTFTLDADQITFCTSWADLFAALDGESEETGLRSAPWGNAAANDRATLTWDEADEKLTVVSERIEATGAAFTQDCDIASIEFKN